MSRWLRMALAAQLLFFVGWGGRLMTSHRDVAVVWLATEPVDPRDLLSGNYVALRFRIGSPETAGCESGGEGAGSSSLYVQLLPTGEPVETSEGPVVISEPVACVDARPRAARGVVWMAGQQDPERRRIVYGIERMFVGEDNPLRTAAGGTVVTKVAINDQFEGRLLELVSKQTPAAGVR